MTKYSDLHGFKNKEEKEKWMMEWDNERIKVKEKLQKYKRMVRRCRND